MIRPSYRPFQTLMVIPPRRLLPTFQTSQTLPPRRFLFMVPCPQRHPTPVSNINTTTNFSSISLGSTLNIIKRRCRTNFHRTLSNIRRNDSALTRTCLCRISPELLLARMTRNLHLCQTYPTMRAMVEVRQCFNRLGNALDYVRHIQAMGPLQVRKPVLERSHSLRQREQCIKPFPPRPHLRRQLRGRSRQTCNHRVNLKSPSTQVFQVLWMKRLVTSVFRTSRVFHNGCKISILPFSQ